MAALEKVQSVGVTAEAEQAPPSVAPVETSAQLDVTGKLDEAIADAQALTGVEQQKAAAAVNAALKLLRETQSGRGTADVVLGLLSKRKLAGLVAPDGRTCRSFAVEQLLALGFPFALEVTPEDLDHHRAQEKKLNTATKLLLALLAGFAVAFPIAQLLPDVTLDPSVLYDQLPFAVGMGGVTAVTALALIGQRPASPRATWLRRLLWLSGALALTLGTLYTQSFATFPPGAAAVIAATLLKPKPEPDEEEAATES